MTRWRRAIIVVLGVLPVAFALAASAFAECAWVLWQTKAFPVGSVPELQDAFTSSDECVRYLGARFHGRDDKIQFPSSVIAGGALWQCIPDTVDPRGPKGK